MGIQKSRGMHCLLLAWYQVAYPSVPLLPALSFPSLLGCTREDHLRQRVPYMSDVMIRTDGNDGILNQLPLSLSLPLFAISLSLL